MYSSNKKVINVATGEIKFGQRNQELVSYGIGSCIVVTMFDQKTKTGTMLHVMLPGEAPHYEKTKTKYAYDAINIALNIFKKRKIALNRLKICLIGGGNVLKNNNDSICQNNIHSVRGILKMKNLQIQKESLGGTVRRTARLELDTGNVYFSKNSSQEVLLYQSGFISED
jgi:chemotaxis protein CheD